MGNGSHFFLMVDRDGKELKRDVLVMDLLLCGIQRVEKKWKVIQRWSKAWSIHHVAFKWHEMAGTKSSKWKACWNLEKLGRQR